MKTRNRLGAMILQFYFLTALEVPLFNPDGSDINLKVFTVPSVVETAWAVSFYVYNWIFIT